jgi:membrane-bound serine protease (ClpP class)
MKESGRPWFAAGLVLAAALALGPRVPAAAPAAPARTVCVAQVKGTIGPATASYLARALGEAAGRRAQCLVIQLDTPGGLLDSTKEIIQSFLRAQVPTVVFVAPQGAWAGSAGCFITLAADVAAMAPGTSIGAAHPVQVGGAGEGGKMDETMKQKLENFTASYIEAIAARRHRNAEWARASVRESASITAEQALARNVIDCVAADLPDLLRQLDGRSVGAGTLATAGAVVEELPMTLRERILVGIAHPQVMLVLMLVVMYGVIGELTSPGAILPGVAGTVALVLLMYLASILPMNIAGLLLVGVAIGLFVIDLFAPTHGILTGGGVIAFFLGTFMMFDRSEPFLRLSLAWLVPATVITALFFLFVVGAGIRAQRQPARTGEESLVGRTVVAAEAIGPGGGRVFLEGEHWRAVSREPVAAGTLVAIEGRDGLTLRVKPAEPAKEEST